MTDAMHDLAAAIEAAKRIRDSYANISDEIRTEAARLVVRFYRELADLRSR